MTGILVKGNTFIKVLMVWHITMLRTMEKDPRRAKNLILNGSITDACIPAISMAGQEASKKATA